MERFNILFSGETLPDHDLAVVKRRFARYFRIEDPKRLEAFFSGKRVTLRRNLPKKEAAKVYVLLRRLGIITHIQRADTEKAAPRNTQPVGTEPTKPRRKRQPGAPNMFDVRLSARAGANTEATAVNSSLARAPLVAASIVLLALILVGLRFWGESRAIPDSGMGSIAIDPRQQPIVQVGDKLLLHNRAGLSTQDVPLEKLELTQGDYFEFLSTGELITLHYPAPSLVPDWLRDYLDIERENLGTLLRCHLREQLCEPLLSEIGEGASFLVDHRTNNILLADASADNLRKLDPDGQQVSSQALELSAPVHLALQEGILYLTQADSYSVLVLKPDDQDCGQQLYQVSLAAEDANLTGHIFSGDLAWLNGYWWTLMQSRDGSNAGLYQFDSQWQFSRSIQLPTDAIPDALVRWGTKMLVRDSENERIYRFDAQAREEKPFSSESMAAALESRQSKLSLASSLRLVILLVLFVSAAGLFALGVLQFLRGKVYIPPGDEKEVGFDINSELIEWLDPAPNLELHVRRLGYGMIGLAFVLLVLALIGGASIWVMLALVLMMAGCGIYYYAMLRASTGHLGRLDDHLILVDHTHTYRVGSGPKIQYINNYVMMDDVIVYLGNPLLSPFSRQSLKDDFFPLFTKGIKVDRTTLRVKLIQSRHPMLLGMASLGVTCFIAVLLLLLS